MAYATFEYYQSDYHGRAITTQTDFEGFAARASDIMDADCTPELQECTEAPFVKKCCCALADELMAEMKLQQKGGVVAAESRGKVSKTYVVANNRRATLSLNDRLYSIEVEYLGRWGLLYRGG